MTSLSYPQLVQGLHLQSIESGTTHETLPILNPLAPTYQQDRSQRTHFYTESGKSTINVDQVNQHENPLPIRSLSNTNKPIEII